MACSASLRRATGERNVHIAGRGSDARGAPRRHVLLAQMLLPLLSPTLRVLIILLVAIVALYVVVVLLGVVGIHVPVPGFR